MSSLKRSIDDNGSPASSKQARLKMSERKSTDDIIIVSYDKKGERAEMQDRHSLFRSFDCGVPDVENSALICLFDGHGGINASQYCNENFHKVFAENCLNYAEKKLDQLEKNMKKIFIETYKKIDDTFLIEARRAKPPFRDGSTSSTIFILNNTIYSANIGDSQAFLCRKKVDSSELSAIQLTADHSCINFDERSRIQKSGGNVVNGRLLGILEVSRAFGDGQLKAHGLISIPSVKKSTITDLDLFIICGSDGLYKVFSPIEAMNFVRDKYLEMRQKEHNPSDLFGLIADSLSSEAVLRRSGDNVSVIIVVFMPNLLKLF